MRAFIADHKPNRNLLIQAQPGVGKTHLAVEIAQSEATQGRRIFYAMQNHAHFNTIQAMPHACRAEWYHWLALTAESPDTGNTMCLYPDEMTTWTKKGYPAMKLCDSLCSVYKPNCEFRRQALRTENIIAGTHDHVALGMQVGDFDVAFVDELPLAAFLRPRHIPKDGLRLAGVGPAVDLAALLWDIADHAGEKETIQGRELFDRIGDLLLDVYAQFDDDYEGAKPEVPWISRPADVDKAPYWYIPDLLLLSVQEREAWTRGESQWLNRISLTRGGLMLLKRADPWDQLPAHMIFLDATGNPTIYRQIFERPVEVFSPNVERKGQVYQVAGRLNGTSTFLEKIPGERSERRTPKKRLSKQGLEALDWCEQMIALGGYESPGCVTFLDAVPEFEAVFGQGRCLHFFAQRGSNNLLECDAGFVVGTPQPDDRDLMKQAAMLMPRRARPFSLVESTVDGKQMIHPARGIELRAYQYFDERGQAERYVSGFWNDQDLNAMADVFREQEIIQAIHRFRPITRAVPVFVLTSTPTSEPLTGIFDDLPEALGELTGESIPAGIPNWRAWLRLKPKLMEWWFEGREIDNRLIAGFLDISENTIRRWNWLGIISAEFPDLWQPTKIAPKDKKGGNPKNGLAPTARTPIVN